MMSPLVVKKNTINKEIPFSLLAIFAIFFMVNDVFLDGYAQNYLTRIDGLVLLLFFCIFIYYTFGMAKKDQGIFDRDDVPKEAGVFKSLVLVLLGLVGIFLGGEWIVSGAVYFAGTFGISETFIGLTVVAIGTSLPELATSLMAAKKGNADMAVGGVIGSNIFNLFWVLGCSSIINPISFDSQLNTDIMMLISMTILLLFLVFYGKKNMLAKMEGMIMIMLYLAYIIFLSIRG